MPRGKKKTTTTPKGRKRQAEDNPPEEKEDEESTGKATPAEETKTTQKQSQDGGVNDNSHGKKDSHQKKQSKQQHPAKKGKVQSLTVQEIISDELTSLSLQYWAGDEIKPFDPKIIEEIYTKELKQNDIQRIMLLEVSQYLENYLWKNFDPSKASFAHIMSIIIMVNEKFRGNVPAWGKKCYIRSDLVESFHNRADVFPQFFERVLSLPTERGHFTLREKSIFLLFLINCYQSLEDEMVRKECMKLVSLSLWHSLSPNRLAKELKVLPKLSKLWNTLKQKEAKAKKDQVDFEKTFFADLIKDFFGVLENINKTGSASPDQLLYCERFVELILDLLCQLPTRRFFLAVVEDFHVVIRCRLSKLSELPEGILFTQLVQMMRFYEGFEVNNFTGAALSDDEITELHCKKILDFQKIAFKNHQAKLKSLALSNIHEVENTTNLAKHLGTLNDKELRELAVELALLRPLDKKEESAESREFVMEVINSHFERRISQLQAINDMAIYPTEGLLWNDNVIPSDEYNGERPLALPKLNLQFLTFYDYLLRNYDLFRLESTYEIRGDIEDAVRRCNPRKDSSIKNRVVWNGWSRMALPIKEFALLQVAKPNLGDNKPAQVLAEVQYSLHSFRGQIRDEWDGIKVHDVLFLVTVNPPLYTDEDSSKVEGAPFRDAFGVKYVRAGEVVEIVDEEGTLIKDWEVEQSPRAGHLRKIKLLLDTSQYQQDIDQLDEDVYGTFNLVVRRKPKENNFKAVLETIRDLMNTKTVVPEWLHDIFLGYGDPTSYRLGSSAYTNAVTLNFNDTFLNAEHARKSFQGKLKFVSSKFGKEPERSATVPGTRDKDAMDDDKLNKFKPPFKITFPGKDDSDKQLVVEAFRPPLPGPYPKDQPKHNQVPFTPVQTEAIQSGMSEGLTLVVGPPGTGKTDVAVQIISNWYHNYPNQRILIVTHSNQALNQLFEKIMALDIQQRHLLRLGHGQEYLDTEHDFSKWGRVNYMLNRRLELLAEVDRLAKSLGIVDDVAATCETAEYFFEAHIKTLINNFKKQYPQHYGLQTAVPGASEADLVKLFPFHQFFKNAPQPLFKQETFDEDIRVADGCFNYITSVITELVECRAFELLRSAYDRGNYLVTKQARIVAMTCTHAALKRAELVQLGFKYDNLLMEEAAQILEIETFIPMLLQEHLNQNESRLKRVVLIGDHHQLPPIIKNIAFQKYSHMDQSLFARFVRLGVPTIELDAQGRARSSIAQLYNWRYKKLVDLPSVLQNEEFKLANAGFVHEYQLIDVPDFDGKGEYQPTPYFYQNLGEAEYLVAVYMYMRLLGYPANKISILTTYNGQKHLIRDVLKARTAWNAPFFGHPKVTTVDRFQGQQNDFILLSLVRTKAVGHLRDIRRLVVAMSRARLGLYVFCRRALFENCYELSQTFSLLCQRPDKLELVEAESYPTTRKLDGVPKNVFQVQDVVHMGQLLVSLQQSMQKQLEDFRKEYEAKQQEEILKQQQLLEQQQQQYYDDMQPQSKKPGKKQKSTNPDEEEEEESEEDEM